MLPLVGCSSLSGTEGKGYISADGQITVYAAADRSDPVKVEGTSLDDEPVSITGMRGTPVVVNLWWSACGPCRAEMPQLVAMESLLRARGVKFIAISADEPEQESAAAKFLAEVKIPAPGYIRRAKDDDKFINAIDPKWSGALPALFLYDKTGRKVKMFVGETPMKEVEAAIMKLL